MTDSGVVSLILQGKNEEVPRLDHNKQKGLIHTARGYLVNLGYTHSQIVIDYGAANIEETIKYISEAKDPSANYALVLLLAYWVTTINASIIKGFSHDVYPIPFASYFIHH
jgi:hypothetical protein